MYLCGGAGVVGLWSGEVKQAKVWASPLSLPRTHMHSPAKPGPAQHPSAAAAAAAPVVLIVQVGVAVVEQHCRVVGLLHKALHGGSLRKVGLARQRVGQGDAPVDLAIQLACSGGRVCGAEAEAGRRQSRARVERRAEKCDSGEPASSATAA